MKLLKGLFVVSMVFLAFSSVAEAGDFDWMRDFNIRAQADPSGFRARLAARFQIGDARIRMVLSNIEKPADAYMALRLGEMSGYTPERVVEEYKARRGKGWGALAKSMGIKPGSREFHALKRSQDLYDDNHRGKKHRGKDRGKRKGKGLN